MSRRGKFPRDFPKKAFNSLHPLATTRALPNATVSAFAIVLELQTDFPFIDNPGFLAKVVRAMSRDRSASAEGGTPRGRSARDETTAAGEGTEENSRGRAINVRQTRTGEPRSTSVATTSTSRSVSRGRLSSVPPAHYGGRGGAGNAIRSPSRNRNEVHLISTREGEFGETDEGIEEEDWEEPVEVIRKAQKIVEARSLSRGRMPEVPVRPTLTYHQP